MPLQEGDDNDDEEEEQNSKEIEDDLQIQTISFEKEAEENPKNIKSNGIQN